jgi:hypothetical protein
MKSYVDIERATSSGGGFGYNVIPLDETITIPLNQEMVVTSLDILGSIDVEGTLSVIENEQPTFGNNLTNIPARYGTIEVPINMQQLNFGSLELGASFVISGELILL